MAPALLSEVGSVTKGISCGMLACRERHPQDKSLGGLKAVRTAGWILRLGLPALLTIAA